MLQERISAFNDSAFHRANIKSGNTTKQMQSNKEEKENQPFPTKKIVHSRKNLRLYERPSHYKRRYHCIEELQRRLKLSLINRFEFPEFHGMMYERGRLIRSERREAELCLLLASIVDHVNLAKMTLGHYDKNGKYNHFTYKKLASLTNMSIHRVKRNMKHLQDRGLVNVNRISMITKYGSYKTIEVVIRVNHEIFDIFNLRSEFINDRKIALSKEDEIEERKKRREEYEEKILPNGFRNKKEEKYTDEIKKNISSLSNNLSMKVKKPMNNDEYNPARDRRVLSRAMELLKSNPELGMAKAIDLAVNQKNNLDLSFLEPPPD